MMVVAHSTAIALLGLLLSTPAIAGSNVFLFANTAEVIRTAMLGSIRTRYIRRDTPHLCLTLSLSWEQGTAAGAILEWNDPAYSVFARKPFVSHDEFPRDTLQLAYSAAVRQTADGRLSQNINDALDGAALDGASAGSVVLMGMNSKCMIKAGSSAQIQGRSPTQVASAIGKALQMRN